tara:strand:- start:2478 stop:2714 length:237 start_codon:yes stop_codon:yes gene_type:complete
MDYFSWSTLFYLIGLILAGSLTLVSTRYRKIMKELGDVVTALEKANEDKKVTNAEKKLIMKEVLDVVKAIIGLKWKIF